MCSHDLSFVIAYVSFHFHSANVLRLGIIIPHSYTILHLVSPNPEPGTMPDT